MLCKYMVIPGNITFKKTNYTKRYTKNTHYRETEMEYQKNAQATHMKTRKNRKKLRGKK